MKKVTIYDYKTQENKLHNLIAEIKDNGDFALSEYDCGQLVKSFMVILIMNIG